MMQNSKIQVGIVGAGKNTVEKHIPGLLTLEGVEIISVCNRSRASSQRVAEQFGISTIYDQWWDLVAASDTNAIVIGTWPNLHQPITMAALAAGKHVLCEARMAMDLAEALAMWGASRTAPHLVAQIVPSPMTLHVDKTIQKRIAAGYLGEILAINIQATGTGAFIDLESPLHWRQDRDLSGHNIMGMGIWYEALMRWVGEARNVSAIGKTVAKMRINLETGKMQAVHIPEHLNILADLACGALASLQFSSVTGLLKRNEAWILGSEGTLYLSDGILYGARKGEQALAEIVIAREDRADWRVEEEFVNAIRGIEKVQLTNFETGVKYMAFTEAVWRSMQEGRTIPL